jgi:aspartate aminotransferase
MLGEQQTAANAVGNKLANLDAWIKDGAAQQYPSLLTQLLNRGRRLHGDRLLVFCENYPRFEWGRLSQSSVLEARPETFASYEDALGLPELREALAERDTEALGIALSQENIAITCGATHALHVCLQAFGRPNIPVFVPTPSYSGYRDICKLLGMEIRPYHLGSYATCDLELRMQGLTRPAIVIINTPHNPSGSLLCGQQLDRLIEVAKRSGTLLIIDKVYDYLVYDHFVPRKQPASTAYRSLESLIFVNSFSKNYGLPGLRMGWITATGSMIGGLEAVIEANVVSVPGFTQRFALEALGWDLKPFVADLKNRREYLCRRLNECQGVDVNKPEGGTTQLVGLDKVDGLELAVRLLNEDAMLVLPGVAYYGGDPHTLRLSFGYTCAEIDVYTAALGKHLGWKGS